MRKYFVFATILGVLMMPLMPSTAMAEERGFFKKQYERFQEWRASSAEEKQAAKERQKAKREKAQERHSALNDRQKSQVKKKRMKAKKRRAAQKKKPNQWENMNE